MNAILKDAAVAATKNLSAPLTAALRDRAYRAEWPADIVLELSVKASDGALYIEYPERLEERIQDLEYGTEETAPRTVLRSFMYRYAAHMETDVTNSVVNVLAEIGALG